MTIAISGISGWISRIRRRSGDPLGGTFSDASLAEYIGDGIDYIEEIYPLGYTTSISGSDRHISDTPTNGAIVLYSMAAEYLIKDEKSSQLIANAILAQDGPQKIDTSKAVNAAVKASEIAYERMLKAIDDYKYLAHQSGGQLINNYDEYNNYAFTEGGFKA